LRRVTEEAEYNIKRLRSHASLAIWCGNNEIYEGMRFWGWKRKYEPVIWEEMQKGYDKLFHQLLPSMVKEYDADRFYMHGSPYEANWGRPNTWKIADSHNWGTWYGKKPFESLDTDLARFMSEFGFQAFPEMKTIATFAEPKDYALESEVMNAHQKASIGNALIKQTMALYYDVPEDFEELVYKGLVLQGFGIRHGIEAHRRNRPYCMGSLYWQLNDSWPVVSWSSIDYYGNWKAMHYQGKRAFAPVLLNAFKEGDDLCIYTLSDELKDHKDVTLHLKLMDFNGKVLSKKMVKGEVPANSSVVLHREAYNDLAANPANTLLQMTLKDRKGEVLSEVIYYFSYPKDQELPDAKVSYKVKQQDGKCEVTLSTKQLARDVFVEIPIQGAKFTDNFFDLLPGQTKKIVITSDEIKKSEPVALKIRHLKGIIK
ncbi:MAG: glycoside hydrolase family 2 protein, partial [Bacteroidaceae bacterium]|nr:glycoside hydrolase family 2 protein [Bacteroidaceae bacterium]